MNDKAKEITHNASKRAKEIKNLKSLKDFMVKYKG